MINIFIRKKLIVAGFLSSVSLFSTVASYAVASSEFKLTPYGGIDIGQQNTKFKPLFGDNLFKKHLPKGNFFVGVKFNDYFGIEGGYETTLQRKRDVVLNGVHRNDYLGAGRYSLLMLLPRDIARISSKSKISGWHMGITGEYPIYFFSQQKRPLSIIGYAGIKHTTIKLTSNLYYHKDDPTMQTIYELNQKNKKNLVRLSTGLQYFIHQNIGLRVIGSWENTSTLSPKNNGDPELLEARLKNSLGCSIGIVFKS